MPVRMSRSRASASSAIFSAPAICSFEFFLFLQVGGGVLLFLPQALKLLRQFVALRLHGLGFGDGGTAIDVDSVEIPEDNRGIHAALAQLFFDEGQIIADESKIEHKRLG